jgi:hypothetical protein
MNPLTQTLFYYLLQQTLFFHILHRKYSKLQRNVHIFLNWFSILIHQFVTYSYNTNEGKQKKKTR